MKFSQRRLLLAVSWLLFVLQSAQAFNVPTHEVMNENATQMSSLDAVLRNEIRFPVGVLSRFRGKDVSEWIRHRAKGGVRP